MNKLVYSAILSGSLRDMNTTNIGRSFLGGLALFFLPPIPPCFAAQESNNNSSITQQNSSGSKTELKNDSENDRFAKKLEDQSAKLGSLFNQANFFVKRGYGIRYGSIIIGDPKFDKAGISDLFQTTRKNSTDTDLPEMTRTRKVGVEASSIEGEGISHYLRGQQAISMPGFILASNRNQDKTEFEIYFILGREHKVVVRDTLVDDQNKNREIIIGALKKAATYEDPAFNFEMEKLGESSEKNGPPGGFNAGLYPFDRDGLPLDIKTQLAKQPKKSGEFSKFLTKFLDTTGLACGLKIRHMRQNQYVTSAFFIHTLANNDPADELKLIVHGHPVLLLVGPNPVKQRSFEIHDQYGNLFKETEHGALSITPSSKAIQKWSWIVDFGALPKAKPWGELAVLGSQKTGIFVFLP